MLQSDLRRHFWHLSSSHQHHSALLLICTRRLLLVILYCGTVAICQQWAAVMHRYLLRSHRRRRLQLFRVSVVSVCLHSVNFTVRFCCVICFNLFTGYTAGHIKARSQRMSWTRLHRYIDKRQWSRSCTKSIVSVTYCSKLGRLVLNSECMFAWEWKLFTLRVNWTELSKVLHPIRHIIGHFRDVLPSQTLGSVLKKLNPTKRS